MSIPIRRFDTTLPLPEYKTEGAAAMDLCARERVVIPARGTGVVPLNVAVQLPPGHFALLAARSSLWKRGLLLANGIGILDEDYAGDEDEYKAALLNFTDEEVIIEKGERIVQVVILPYDRVSWQEVASLGNPSRGGFGTTGK